MDENTYSLSLPGWKGKVIPSCYILICIIICRLFSSFDIFTAVFLNCLYGLKLEVMWVQYLVYFWFSGFGENAELIHLHDRLLRIKNL